MATQVEFDYGLARFISFRDRAACERVRQCDATAEIALEPEAPVPGSILQTARTDYTILGGVADDVEIHMP